MAPPGARANVPTQPQKFNIVRNTSLSRNRESSCVSIGNPQSMAWSQLFPSEIVDPGGSLVKTTWPPLLIVAAAMTMLNGDVSLIPPKKLPLYFRTTRRAWQEHSWLLRGSLFTSMACLGIPSCSRFNPSVKNISDAAQIGIDGFRIGTV